MTSDKLMVWELLTIKQLSVKGKGKDVTGSLMGLKIDAVGFVGCRTGI